MCTFHRRLYEFIVLLSIMVTLMIQQCSVSASSESEQESTIKQFPQSYQDSIRDLQTKHPNWAFVPVDTNINWNTLLSKESKLGVNTIYSGAPYRKALNAPLSYLRKVNGSYRPYDGVYWFAANRQTIAYYLDPRNFLSESKVFQFQSLKYESTQSKEMVQRLLRNTFMKGNATKTKSYASVFVEAAKRYDVNAYFLASRAKHELGSKGSIAVSGKVNGFRGIYNFFNIGANDTASGNAALKGLRFAKAKKGYLRPWTSPYKAILGGAQYIASEYIKFGQYTYYFQKFNVVYKDYLFNHQYLTNVQGPYMESLNYYNTFRSLGILDTPMTFYIPIFDHMPVAPCELPDGKGSVNDYIKKVSILNRTTKKSMLTKFSPQKRIYFIPVKAGKYTIQGSAKPSSLYSKIRGTGRVTLHIQKNSYQILTFTCTSRQHTIRNYQFVFYHGLGLHTAKDNMAESVIKPANTPNASPDITEQDIVDPLMPSTNPSPASIIDPEMTSTPEPNIIPDTLDKNEVFTEQPVLNPVS